jgi:hypothetical protein
MRSEAGSEYTFKVCAHVNFGAVVAGLGVGADMQE